MHLDIVILAVILLILALAIAILGVDLLVRMRRKTPPSVKAENPSSDVPRVPAPAPVLKVTDHPPLPQTKSPKPEEEAAFAPHRPAPQALGSNGGKTVKPQPDKLAFSAIQDEIRAALQAATKEAPSTPSANPALLNWSEPGRLAVLSLGDASPTTALSLLQAQGVHILIVPETHPFPTPNRNIELLCLSDHEDASLTTLATGLRAKLAKGERIAFYTETGLTGSAALLAARLSSRSAV